MNQSPARVQRFILHSRSEPELGGQKQVSILIVEDNPADVILVRKALEEYGVAGELTLLMDGEAAIRFVGHRDRALSRRPDLVIIDLNVPKKDGRLVLECVRNTEWCRTAPVVILSSSDAQQDRDDTARLGASRYIRKPSRLDDFLELGAIFGSIMGTGDTP